VARCEWAWEIAAATATCVDTPCTDIAIRVEHPVSNSQVD
jgi:hypothetical protein